MRATDNFRRQHKDLLAVVGDIQGHLDPAALVVDAAGMRRLLGRLGGLLTMHVAMEDEALYPRMLGHARADVRDVASKLQREFGGIYSASQAFLAHWRVHGNIEGAASTFISEVTALIGLLGARIEREERELYALADTL